MRLWVLVAAGALLSAPVAASPPGDPQVQVEDLGDWATTPDCDQRLCAACAIEALIKCRLQGGAVAEFDCVGYGIPPALCMCLYSCTNDNGIDRVFILRSAA